MDRREAEYRGHQILVEADERSPNCWGWSYFIDGRTSSKSHTALCPDIEDALRQGMAAAQSRVDDIEAKAA
jgi:hypothetical protein